MQAKQNKIKHVYNLVPEKLPREISQEDERIFFSITSEELTGKQIKKIKQPEAKYPHQKVVLAAHWHPEFVSIDMAMERMRAMFPNLEKELVIPTQHNELLTYKGYSGVEVDCYSRGFNQKVQLLLHFERDKVKEASILKSMLEHTRKYRASQLFEFIRAITGDNDSKLQKAARETGAGEDVVRFTQIYVKKIEELIEKHYSTLPANSIKNKVLRNFFDSLRPVYSDQLIDRVLTFIKSIKKMVKADFNLNYFYRTSEIIEEARLHGGGIVVPHPEQFWPILLAEYDVDGYEVWNPQSQRYTDFLISVVNRKNAEKRNSQKELLIFMGDDTHMGEKAKDPAFQNKEKAGREIGYQPAWDDMHIRKKLITAQVNRTSVIDTYKERLAG
ncbi:MAG: hypothetical protein ACLFSY_02810 [Desulfonatronovibrionaceae bacterium]